MKWRKISEAEVKSAMTDPDMMEKLGTEPYCFAAGW
jgi:hypothetical protein